uniref:Uncharacterized protein n=1 Tax=viral metagenome TaxID=1070528 RepID=A0A6C0HS61_9ZZZZ
MEKELHCYLDEICEENRNQWLRENIVSIFYNFAIVVRHHYEAKDREIIEIIVKNFNRGIDMTQYS